MPEILASVALGIAGAIALWGLYRALELNWPEQYVSLNDTFALRVTQTWWRFLVYRFVPLFAAGIGLWATAERIDGFPVLAVCTASVIHVAHTNLRALFESFGKLQRHRRFTINYASYHLLIIGIITVATVASCVFGPSLAFLVPAPHVLLENLWIAIFVAIASGIAVAVIGRRPTDANGFDTDYFVWRAKRDVNIELVDWAFEAALKYRADPILVRSIMFAEALQRPGWVRRAERIKGFFFKNGSYGVTQEYAESPISDREAITRTAMAMSHSWALFPNEYGWTNDEGMIWKFAARHNEDIAFIEGVQKVYQIVERDYSGFVYGDPHKGLHIIETRRYPHEFGLRGITSASVLQFSYKSYSEVSGSQEFRRPDDVPLAEPWAFELKFPVEVKKLDVILVAQSERAIFDLSVTSANL